jgi:hypothetical protein
MFLHVKVVGFIFGKSQKSKTQLDLSAVVGRDAGEVLVALLFQKHRHRVAS